MEKNPQKPKKKKKKTKKKKKQKKKNSILCGISKSNPAMFACQLQS